MLRGNAIKALLGYNPIGPRITMAQFKTSCGKTTIVQVHAPTDAHSSEEEVEEFYSDLQNTIQRVSSKDLLIVMGDYNAKVGSDSDMWRDEFPDGVTKNEINWLIDGNAMSQHVSHFRNQMLFQISTNDGKHLNAT